MFVRVEYDAMRRVVRCWGGGGAPFAGTGRDRDQFPGISVRERRGDCYREGTIRLAWNISDHDSLGKRSRKRVIDAGSMPQIFSGIVTRTGKMVKTVTVVVSNLIPAIPSTSR